MTPLITILTLLDFSQPDVIKENIRPFLTIPSPLPPLFLHALNKACDGDLTELMTWLFFKPEQRLVKQTTWRDAIRALGNNRLSLQGLSLSSENMSIHIKNSIVFPQADFSKATLDGIIDLSSARYVLQLDATVRFALFSYDQLMSLLSDMLYQAVDDIFNKEPLDVIARSSRLAKEKEGYLSKVEQSYLDDAWHIAQRLLEVLQSSRHVTPEAKSFLRKRLSRRDVHDLKKLYHDFELRQKAWQAPFIHWATPVMDYANTQWLACQESRWYKESQIMYSIVMLGVILFAIWSQEMPAAFILHALLSVGILLSGVELGQFIELMTSFIKMPLQLGVAAYLGGEVIEQGLWGMERESHPAYLTLAFSFILFDSAREGMNAYYIHRERRCYKEAGKLRDSTYLESLFHNGDDLLELSKDNESLSAGVSAGLKQIGQYVTYMTLPYAATLATLGGLYQSILAPLLTCDWNALGNDIKLLISGFLLSYHGYRRHQADTVLVKTFQHYKATHFGYETALALLTALAGPSALKQRLLGSQNVTFHSALVTHPVFTSTVLGTFNGSFLWRFIFFSRKPADSHHVNIQDDTFASLLTKGEEILGYATPYSLRQGLAAIPTSSEPCVLEALYSAKAWSKTEADAKQPFWRQVTFGDVQCPTDTLQSARDFLTDKLSVVKPLAYSKHRFFVAQSRASGDGVILNEIPSENITAASELPKQARALSDLVTFGMRTFAVERR